MREAKVKVKGTNIEDLPDAEEWFQQIMERMPVEKRLTGLDAPQLVASLPLEILRGLSEDYIRSLPLDVQQKVRRRLQEEAH